MLIYIVVIYLFNELFYTLIKNNHFWHCRQAYNLGNKNTVIDVYNSTPVFLLQEWICQIYLFNNGLTCMLMLLSSWHIRDITFIHPLNKVHIYYRLYTGCPRSKGQNFGRVCLMLKYTDITQNTYIQSRTVTEIMAREKCGLLVGLRTVRCQLTTFRMSVLDCHVRLQKYLWRSYVSTPLSLTMRVMYSAWNP